MKYESYNPEIYYPEDSTQSSILPPAPEPSGGKGKGPKGNKKQSAAAKSGKTASKKKKNDNGKGIFSRIGEALTSFTSRLICGISLAGFATYLTVAFISYFSSCIKDQSVINNNPVGQALDVANNAGEAGARISEFFINEGFGLGSFVIIFWLFAIALKCFDRQRKYRTVSFTIKCLVALVTVSLIIGLMTFSFNSPVNWGGYHGRYVNEFLIGFIGMSGAVILCIVLIAIFVVICMRDFINWIIRKKKAIAERRRIQAELKEQARLRQQEIDEMKRREQEDAIRAAGAAPSAADDSISADTRVAFDAAPKEGYAPNGTAYGMVSAPVAGAESYALADEPEMPAPNPEIGPEETSVSPAETAPEASTPSGPTPDDAQEAAEADSPEEAGNDLAAPMQVNVNQIAEAAPTRNTVSAYRFPSPELLEQRGSKISVDPEEQLANKEKIRKTLLDFGIPIVSIEATVGPTVTLYEIRPDKGHKVSKIKSLVDDISLSLSAIGVRIIAPIPGKGTVGIEVANKDPQTVSMRTLIQSRKFQETKAALPLALGATISNDVYIADLASIPHLLVAGATGQGKSVGLNVIISSLLYKKRPYELKFVLFDPKMVEFSLYAAIEKQYLAKLPDAEEAIITDMSKVVPTLSSLCVEMDNRYRLLKQAEVRKLEEYNTLVKTGKLNSADGHKFLPYIVVIVDEFSDLIMTAGKEAELPIARLAQKARAVGVHVIIATQRPSTAVITGNIKTNFPGRIAFKVSSGVDSKVILDATGAQQLIGRGDMLVLNNSEMVRVQCAFIDTPEVKRICEHIGNQPYPAEDSPYILPEPVSVEGGVMNTDGSSNLADKDPLYDEIKQYVITSGTASTSNLQRRYGIGYNRAGKIMDQLEEAGIVGPSMGGKPRAVLVQSL